MSGFTFNLDSAGKPINKFKNKMGMYYLKSLFWENKETDFEGIYTLKDNDHVVDGKVYPSLYKLYMQEEDLTEYDFATKHLDSWAHWQLLQSKEWFQEYITRWRTELEMKLRSEAMKAIIDEARVGGRNSYDAKKYILAKGWIDKTAEPNRRGRPSKAEIAKQTQEMVLGDKIVQDAMKRLDLN